MLKAIISKEWIKTRWVLLGLVVLIAGFTAYDFLAMSKNADLRGYMFLWSFILQKDSVMVDNLRFLPLVAGALLALSQFIPEYQQKRLKLTLHLPYPHAKMILDMQAYGLVILLLLFALQLLAIGIFFNHYLVADLVRRILLSVLVWDVAGLAAYIWVSAICLEPSWKLKVFEFAVLAGVLSIFFISSSAMAYRFSLLPLFLVAAVAGMSLIHLSIARFKEGAFE